MQHITVIKCVLEQDNVLNVIITIQGIVQWMEPSCKNKHTIHGSYPEVPNLHTVSYLNAREMTLNSISVISHFWSVLVYGSWKSLPYWHDLTFMVLQLINLNSWSLVFLSINSFFKPRSFKENCDKFHFLLLLRINMLRRLKYFCNFQENRNAERLFFKLLKEVAGMLNPVKE